MKKSTKEKPLFNRQEKAILKVVYEERRDMSIKEIAEKAHMSWSTARNHIQNLIKRGWLEEKKEKK